MTLLSINSEIDQETISKLVFKSSDVLNSEREKIRRNASLLKAAVLDSLSKIEVVLTLEDKESLKKLRSRIIATGDERVMLEAGLSIPVHCIKHVEFPS
jgi:acyl carrier protein